ncbi:hypothetical protein ACFYXL_16725 [Streptomyces tsukubensis]|uniref:hypothetical protein n=1 Tax=Streptomyces tsukubensis TaxID=83656 RepID=UPI0036BFA0B2
MTDDQLRLPRYGWAVEPSAGPIELKPPAPGAAPLLHIPVAISLDDKVLMDVEMRLSPRAAELLIMGMEEAMAASAPTGGAG